MAHKFGEAKRDPYVESAHEVERHVFGGRSGIDAAASDQTLNALSNAIVTALGDIAAVAFRLGVSRPGEVEGLANATKAACDAVFAAYKGEMDPGEAIEAIRQARRQDSLTDVQRRHFLEEVEKTKSLEDLVLTAKRLPDLVDLLQSLDLEVDADVLNQGIFVLGSSPTRHADSAEL